MPLPGARLPSPPLAPDARRPPRQRSVLARRGRGVRRAHPARRPGSPAARSSNRLLLHGEDDASLFPMAAGPLGDGAAVSVVLVRATAKPPPLPRFTCTFYANPPPGAAELAGSYFFATVPVRSSALADGAGVAPEKELYFAVPRETLHGSNRELFLSVRIDRSPAPEPAALEDKKMMITDHSNSLKADQ